MRTLDEVIKAWSICFSDNSRSNCTGCPYADEDGEAACFNHDREDALHYLKMYRSDQIQWEADREDWRDKWETYIEAREMHLDAVKELKRNDPLSWEKLKAMEGKPVWVEMVKPDVIKAWFLICQIDDSFMWVADGKGESHNFPRVCLDTGLWQAYRKERS